ncbi:MAG: hypothetical protein FD130_2252 [Halothiobacillaceae bacterium]|nr:MAG: hypothetical protein FD130_2252 [Halothiobacillaceae bacterium]
MKQRSDTPSERRRFCRANDEVYLEYLVLEETEVAKAINEFNSQSQHHFNPLNQLQAITAKSQQLLGSLREQSPQTADYLQTVEERLQLLAHAIAQDQVGVPIEPNESVNLSAGGLSFSSEIALESGRVVEFSIIIAPQIGPL